MSGIFQWPITDMQLSLVSFFLAAWLVYMGIGSKNRNSTQILILIGILILVLILTLMKVFEVFYL